jgi:hypothetical protein
MTKQGNLLPADIDSINHWGKTPDGRCVLLDYGYTEDVHKSHYSNRVTKDDVDQYAKTEELKDKNFIDSYAPTKNIKSAKA